MFFKLKDSYQLVGWKELPTGVLDRVKNEVAFLPRNEFALLLHMNGQEDINPDTLTREQRDILRRFQEQGAVQESSERFPKGAEEFYRYRHHAYIDRVQWGITGKCNFNCRHCFVSSPGNQAEELTTGQCLEIIRQIADCGIRKVALTGGEPLVRRDLPELLSAFSEAGIRITELYTNGALLTPGMLEQFTRGGHRPLVQVSHDGVGWHDWVRGHNGAQCLAERALLTAHEAGLKTRVAMSLFRDNIPSIRETVRHLSSLHVDIIKISPMMPMGLWKENYAEKTLSDEEFLEAVLEYIPCFFEDGKPCDLKMGGFFDYFRDKDVSTSTAVKDPASPAPLYPCVSMAYNLYIGPDGRVLPCMSFEGHPEYDGFPNLLQTSLEQLLCGSELLKIMRTRLTDLYALNTECAECPERGRHCGQSCRACAQPDFRGIDRSVCFLVKDSRFKRIQEAVEKAGGQYALM